MAAGREVGGLGGSLEGVGKTDGLGEGEQDSDMVDEGERERESSSGCFVKVADEKGLG